MKAYYNEIDPHCVAWLKELITKGLITNGDVDDRSIEDVQPGDVVGYDRVHWFAGIGGWDYALNLAGWTGPVWTGSCPCQPWSVAGNQGKHDDPRHLWPHLFRRIRESTPNVVFGEQVAGKHGLEWLAGVHADLEDIDYAFGAADLCAAGEGAPHIRQRLYWVADSTGERGRRRGEVEGWRHTEPRGSGATLRLGDTNHPRLEGRNGVRLECGDELPAGSAGLVNPWGEYEVIRCLDGKQRRFEPKAFPLAHGLPGRMAVRRTIDDKEQAHWYNRNGALRGIGNAIVPQVAAAFIRSYMECR